MIPDPTTPFGVPLAVLNRYLKSLYEADWKAPRGAIWFSPEVQLAELARADIFHNARIFLTLLREEAGTPTTATGNLTRAFVERVFDRLRLEESYKASLRGVCKVLNEPDVWPLHQVRLLAEYGKLVARRDKRLVLTKRGREALADGQAGELFRRLFLTFFRTMEMSYLLNLRSIPELQAAMAISLWRLEQVAEGWRAASGMAAQILPPRVLARLVAEQRGVLDSPDYFVAAYVLSPLHDFGLVERRQENEWRLGTEDTVRVTPLFRRLIRFAEFPSAFGTN